ncbi:hypothetical protein ABW20_dc0107233 [Dactylellina cionopaga]|nr:hypothetical protein ABW20_dc0107233 [Dactylellina cionopaga]
MTRPNRNPTGATPVKGRNELAIPRESKLYAFCSRMKQTPVRSMLHRMAHGCCFDYFEKGFCKAGNDCKYSHLKPGDERNLVMDSEQGLRRKKYYRPETLQTYLPGSQDIICFTFARKGWCIHGDRCWNQHISPPVELLTELASPYNGLPISQTPSPVQDDIPTTIDTGYGLTQPLALTQVPSPVVMNVAPHWSATTIVSPVTGPPNANTGTTNEHLLAAASQGKCTLYCQPDPQRTASSNWRVPSKPVAAKKAATPTETPQQPVRSALNFNWRPIIHEGTPQSKWQKATTTSSTTVGCRPTLPTLQIPGSTFGLVNTPVNYDYNLIDYSDAVDFDHQKYRLGFGLGQPGIPYFH